MDQDSIAQTLYALTRNWNTNVSAREELAIMLHRDLSTGFPAPVRPDASGLSSNAWNECVDAAKAAPERIRERQTATPPISIPSYALLTQEENALAAGVSWPSAPNRQPIPAPKGPLWNDPNPRGYLYLFDEIDTDFARRKDGESAPGLYPRQPAGAAASPTPKPRPGLFLFVVSVFFAVLSLTFISGSSGLALRAVAEIKTAAKATYPDPHSKACIEQISRSQTMEALEAAREICREVWSDAWENQRIDRSGVTPPWLLKQIWLFPNINGGFSLFWPLAFSVASVVTLIIASGYSARGIPHGAFIDSRNRFSLSRFQMIGWTIVLLGGYVVLSLFNTAFLAATLRNLDMAQAAGLSEAKGLWESFKGVFPDMNEALWGVLGLTVVISPFLSQAVQNRRLPEGTATDYTRVGPATASSSDPFETRDSWRDARLSDLFMGEEERNKDQIDISRLQYLIITFALLSSYIILMLNFILRVDGPLLLMSTLRTAPPFPSMPPVDVTFLGLLAISHIGYLSFKALPATSAGGVGG